MSSITPTSSTIPTNRTRAEKAKYRLSNISDNAKEMARWQEERKTMVSRVMPSMTRQEASARFSDVGRKLMWLEEKKPHLASRVAVIEYDKDIVSKEVSQLHERMQILHESISAYDEAHAQVLVQESEELRMFTTLLTELLTMPQFNHIFNNIQESTSSADPKI